MIILAHTSFKYSHTTRQETQVFFMNNDTAGAMLDNPLPCSQTLTSERRRGFKCAILERACKSTFFFLQTLYCFLLFYHCPLSEGTNRFESKLFTPLIKTPKQVDNVRRFLHALDTYTEKKSVIIMLTTRQMKHKVNLRKNIIVSKKKHPYNRLQ